MPAGSRGSMPVGSTPVGSMLVGSMLAGSMLAGSMLAGSHGTLGLGHWIWASGCGLASFIVLLYVPSGRWLFFSFGGICYVIWRVH
jgi:hypothetical protein